MPPTAFPPQKTCALAPLRLIDDRDVLHSASRNLLANWFRASTQLTPGVATSRPLKLLTRRIIFRKKWRTFPRPTLQVKRPSMSELRNARGCYMLARVRKSDIPRTNRMQTRIIMPGISSGGFGAFVYENCYRMRRHLLKGGIGVAP